MDDRVQVTISGGVADVRMVRADKMNALDAAMFEALVATAKKLGGEKGLRAVVLSGEGRAFCAGLDMGRFAAMKDKGGYDIADGEARDLTVRTHGIALDGDHIWCVGSDEAEIYKLQMSDGAIVAKIVLDKTVDPSLHGLDMKDGVLWYCDANKGWICNLT